MRLEAHFGDRVVRCFADRPRNVNALFAEALARNPDGEALVCDDERLTWHALDETVARAAAGLARRGIVPGDRVALLLGNRNDFVISWLAAARLGAIPVPMSTRAPLPEVGYMLAHCGAALIVHEPQLANRRRAAGARTARAGKIPGRACMKCAR